MLYPKRVPLKGVRYIAAGATHTVAVTDEAVYSWGHGQHGALGHGTYDDKVSTCAALQRVVQSTACYKCCTVLLLFALQFC